MLPVPEKWHNEPGSVFLAEIELGSDRLLLEMAVGGIIFALDGVFEEGD